RSEAAMRVVICEDLVLLRDGLASLLTDDGNEVVAAVGDGDALIAAVDEHYASDLLGGGSQGVGYLLKDRVADVREFLSAARRVAAGGTAIDPEVVSQLLSRRQRTDVLDELTPREREVLGLMAEGHSNGAIAERLVVTNGAVEKHVSSVFMKLGLPPTDQQH